MTNTFPTGVTLKVAGRLLSLNVGLPRDVAWQGRTVHTGVWKYPVDGPRLVRRLNIDGDGQGDLAGHGGEMRAVLVYQRESYDHWRKHLNRDQLEFGSFGENFTVDGLPDHEVSIGDRYRIGEAEFEVTQPRVTCFRVGMRLGEPAMPSLLVAHQRPGFYLRVITEGRVAAGDPIVRTRVGRHALSVATIDGLLYLPHRDVGTLRRAVTIEALSPGWQQSFRDMLAAVDRGGPIDTPAVGVEPGWPGFRPLVVVRTRAETPSVTSFWLADPDGSELPAPAPGQFLTVRVPAAGTPPPVRSYSISAVPDARAYRISVKREAHGTVSRYLHDTLLSGATVEVAAPRGDFTLTDGAGPVVLLSAGIGATPVLAMLRHLAAQRTTREVWWLAAARDATEHPFAAEARALLADLPHAHERVFYSRAPLSPPPVPASPAPDLPPTAGAAIPPAADALAQPAVAAAQTPEPPPSIALPSAALPSAVLPSAVLPSGRESALGGVAASGSSELVPSAVLPSGRESAPGGVVASGSSELVPSAVLPSGRESALGGVAAAPPPEGSAADGVDPSVTTGRLTAEVIAGLGLPATATAYVCGPDAFMAAMREALTAAGLPPGNVHSELFGALPPINPGVVDVHVVPPHQPPGDPGTGPLVTFARSGISARTSTRFGSLLEMAEACDVPTRWSCRIGVCHTCVTPLLSGKTDYVTPPLEEPGPGEVLVCCALPDDDVVLDL